MQGLRAELQYPSQKRTEKTRGGIHFSQKALHTYIMKNGSQQTMNPPTIIPVDQLNTFKNKQKKKFLIVNLTQPNLV